MNIDELIKELEKEEAKPIKGWLMNHSLGGRTFWNWVNSPPNTAFNDSRDYAIKVWQRATRGWADEDTWSLDYYILSWLPDALEKVAEDSHGAPINYGFSKKEIKEFYKNNPSHEVIDSEFSYEAWKNDVKAIATILRDLNKKQESILLTEEDEKLFRHAWKRLGKIFFTLWT